MECPVCKKNIKTLSHIRRCKDNSHKQFVIKQEKLAVQLYKKYKDIYKVLNNKNIILTEYINVMLRNMYKNEIYETNRINRNKKISEKHTNVNSLKYKFKQQYYKDINGTENIDFVCCKICGFRGRQITSHLNRIHNINKDKYLELYPNSNIVCFNTNKKISEKLIESNKNHDNHRMELNGRTINKNVWGKCGIRNDLNEFYRSSWEANIARLLRFFNIKYEYEIPFELSYNNSKLIYIVDFYLTELDIFLEIKGFWDDMSKLKVNLFQTQIDKKLFVIDKNEYMKLNKQYKQIIKNWE